jgi:sorbitol-specific phosphotransferase system component IIBC
MLHYVCIGLQPAYHGVLTAWSAWSGRVMPAVRFLSEDVWVSGVSDKGMAHNIAVQSSKAGGTDERHSVSVCRATISVERSVGASAPKTKRQTQQTRANPPPWRTGLN